MYVCMYAEFIRWTVITYYVGKINHKYAHFRNCLEQEFLNCKGFRIPLMVAIATSGYMK
jgi:hypothetical protein